MHAKLKPENILPYNGTTACGCTGGPVQPGRLALGCGVRLFEADRSDPVARCEHGSPPAVVAASEPPPPPTDRPASPGTASCPHCRRDTEPGSPFCTHCRRQLVDRVPRCRRCGADVHPADRVCPHCGQPLDPAAPPVTLPPGHELV